MTSMPPAATLPAPDPVHDRRHALRDGPLERESMPYIVSLPELGIASAIYTWVDREHRAGALFGVFGPAVGEQPVIAAIDDVAMPANQDFDDWSVGPVTVAHALDLQHARIDAKSERAVLELHFDALHPAYAYSSHARGCPAFAATDRIEQSGRIRGHITLDGKRHAFKTTGARDHSWGTRDWDYAQHWKWLHAQAGATAVHFWEIELAGRTELRGYVFRDGVMAEVSAVETRFEVDSRWQQKSIASTITDSMGRVTKVAGAYFGHFEFQPGPNSVLVEGAMGCEIDGVRGTGWTEFMWPSAYLAHLRASV